jgi:hypothetical protein
MALQDRTDPAYLVPAEEAILEVLPEGDPEAADLLDSVSPGESMALLQEVEARTDESFREAAKLESERCAKMARDLAELRDRMGKELKLVERQHAKWAARAELLRRYLSDDEPVPF